MIYNFISSALRKKYGWYYNYGASSEIAIILNQSEITQIPLSEIDSFFPDVDSIANEIGSNIFVIKTTAEYEEKTYELFCAPFLFCATTQDFSVFHVSDKIELKSEYDFFFDGVIYSEKPQNLENYHEQDFVARLIDSTFEAHIVNL